WMCLLFALCAAGVVLLLLLAKRYGAVALPSPEKQSAQDQKANLPDVTAEDRARASPGFQAQPVAVDLGERLPVRLRSQGYAGLLVIGVVFGLPTLCLVLLGLMAFLIWLVRPWLGEPSPAVRRALVVTTLATAGGIVFAVAWRVIRRRRQRRL